MELVNSLILVISSTALLARWRDLTVIRKKKRDLTWLNMLISSYNFVYRYYQVKACNLVQTYEYGIPPLIVFGPISAAGVIYALYCLHRNFSYRNRVDLQNWLISAFQTNMNRSRQLWRIAKKKLLECQGKLKDLIRKTPKPAHNIVFDDLIMEEILKRLDLSERVKLRGVSFDLFLGGGWVGGVFTTFWIVVSNFNVQRN